MTGQDYPQTSSDAVIKALRSDKKGLTLAEAEKRLEKSGSGTLQYPSASWFAAGMRSLARDSFFLILLTAELAAWHLGNGHIMQAVGVALALDILANASFIRRSSRYIGHLEQLLQAPATVTRSGRRQQVDAATLVSGDIVHLAQGEIIPADLRLISTEHLVTDEYNISGSNRHVSKAAKIGAHNIALYGSVVVAGSGSGVVIALGNDTALGVQLRSPDQVVRSTASAAQQRLDVIRSRIGKAAAVLLLVLIIFSLATHTTLDDFLLFAIALAVALASVGLTAELAALQRDAAAPITWVVRAAASDAGALLLLAIIGIIGQAAYHVPMAITAVQIVAASIVALMLPITGLAGERPKKFTASAPGLWLGFGLLSAALAYANFLFFFERRGISPVHLDSSSTLYLHAATLSFVTIILCRWISLFFVRAEHRERFLNRHLFSNTALLVALVCSAVLVVLCIYSPPLRQYFDTQPLNITDWLTALLAAVIFFSFHLFQRHTRKHTRQAVIELHRNLNMTHLIH